MNNDMTSIYEKMKRHVVEGTPSDVVERYAELPGLSHKLTFGPFDENVVVIDTETTGLSFNHDELIQIAAARMQGGEVVDWFVTFVNPGKAISDEISHLTGITNEHVKDAPEPGEALAKLAEFVGDAYVVAHNALFDKTFTTRHPEGYPLLENTWIDSLDLSRIALPRMKSHRLIDLVHAFDAPVSTHRADDDVAATCVVYRILLSAVACMPQTLVAQIARMATDEQWPTRCVFEYIASHHPGNANEIGQANNLFSLQTMRRRRIKTLPSRKSKADAADLALNPSTELAAPTEDEINNAFSESGVLGKIYEQYEPREEQRSMAQAVAKAFESSRNLVVEAGTGVGKSMAYLVPSALMAMRNNIAVGVATKTNSLLDQLVFKELPDLREALAEEYPHSEPLTWASLKGITHYPCLRKVTRLVEAGPGTREVAGVEVSQAPALAALLSYIEQTDFDDMDSLKIDYRALPRYLFTTTSTECLRRKCP